MNPKHVKALKAGNPKKGPVVYWMSRDQRTQDNWALLFAQKEGLKQKEPLAVVFLSGAAVFRGDFPAVCLYDPETVGSRAEFSGEKHPLLSSVWLSGSGNANRHLSQRPL